MSLKRLGGDITSPREPVMCNFATHAGPHLFAARAAGAHCHSDNVKYTRVGRAFQPDFSHCLLRFYA